MPEQSHNLSVMLGEVVRDLLHDQRMTAQALAGALGVDGSVVSRTLNGTIIMTVDRMLAIEQALGVRPGTVLRRAGLIAPDAMELEDHLAVLREEFNEMERRAEVWRSGRQSPPASPPTKAPRRPAKRQRAPDNG